MQLRHAVSLITALVPQTLVGPAIVGPWVSLAAYRHCAVFLTQGALGTGGNPQIGLRQAQSFAGAENIQVPMTMCWQQDSQSGATGWVARAMTNNLFLLANLANQNYVLEVDAAQLDVDGGYAYMRLEMAVFGTGHVCQAMYLLTAGRYGQERLPNPLVA